MEITNLYESGHFTECITKLEQLNTHSLLDELTKVNNVAACKFQSKSGGTFEEFSRLGSKLSCLVHDQHFSYLTLTSACNAIYSVVNRSSKVDLDVVTSLACQAIEVVSSQQKLPGSCMELDLYEDRFALLTRRLTSSRCLGQRETSLILYLCTLLSVLEARKDITQLMKELLAGLDSLMIDSVSVIHQPDSPCFLLFPVGFQASQEWICDLSIVVLSTVYCVDSSWSDVVDFKEVQHPRLRGLQQFLTDYARFRSPSNTPVQRKNSSAKEDDEDRHLKFARCLLAATELSSSGKPMLALKYLSTGMAEDLGRTQACAMAMILSASYFKALGEYDCQIEALKVAEESLLKSPALECSFHEELIGFILSESLKFFHSPGGLVAVRYLLARSLIEAQRYQEAATEYKKLTSSAASESIASVGLVQLSVPHTEVVYHEHVLSLVKSADWDAALEVIDSAPHDDFLLLLLQADIRLQLDQQRKAIQLLNQAIKELNSAKPSELPVDGAKERLKSKVYCRLAQVLEAAGNTKDAFYQFRLAFQLAPDDVHVLESYKMFVESKRMPLVDFHEPSKQPDGVTEQLLKLNHDWALHCFIQDGTFLR